VVNPDEKRGGTDQFTLSLERQLSSSMGVRATAVYIRTFDEPRILNTLRPPSVFNIPVTNPDPGPDGRAGTADDPGTFVTYYEYPAALAGRNNEVFMIATDPTVGERHRAIDLQLTKRISRNWQFLVGYTATKNDNILGRPSESFFGLPTARSVPPWDPNATFNKGNHSWDTSAKMSGIYRLPADVNVSANFDYQSGAPTAREVLFTGGRTIPNIALNVEPIGTRRLPAVTVVDLRADKNFVLRGNHRATLRANVYNLLNANTVTAQNMRSGASFLLPLSVLPARIVEFGVGYSF
jgi:hypothetical protein